MRLTLTFIAVAALSACGAAAPVEAVDEPSLDALRALPPGVSTNDIGLQSGCYVYNSPNGTKPLTNPRGQQICA